MDYRFLTQKTLSLINTSFILLFFSTNISAFETNSDSKITANLEVTDVLKLGSVDSSSDGIITSITDSSDSTVPSAGAVKAYLDAQVAGSSGGYPSEVGYWVDAGNFSLNYCRDIGAGWRIPSLNEVLNVVPPNTTDKYIWTTDPGFAADQYIAVRVTDGRFVSLNAIGGLAPDGWSGYYVCVR